MARRMGDQTEFWQGHRPIGSVAGFYYDEELAGPHGLHCNLWIGDYSPNSREVRRAVRRLQNNRDMVSWSYSRCQPAKAMRGSLTPDGALDPLIPPPFLGEVILRERTLDVIANLLRLDTGAGTWLASEALRLEAVLENPAPAPGSTNEEVIEGALQIVAGLLKSGNLAPPEQLAKIVASIESLLVIDAEADAKDLSAVQKAIHVLKLTDDGSTLAPSHFALLEMAIKQPLHNEGAKVFDAVYRDVVAGCYDSRAVVANATMKHEQSPKLRAESNCDSLAP